MHGAIMIFRRLIPLACIILPLLATPSRARAGGPEHAESDARGTLDPALSTELESLDRKTAEIRDLTTDFEEQKFTTLLKKPLTSHGTLRIVGSHSRWDTISPRPVSMIVDAAGIRMYYPQRSTLEVYQLDEKLTWLAVSPLPKPAVWVDRFTIERIPVPDLGDVASAGACLGLRLRPREEALGKYLRHVDVVLNTTTAFMVRAAMVDADGDRTVVSFSNIRPNTGLEPKDLELTVPADTQIVRPLAGFEKKAPGTSP